MNDKTMPPGMIRFNVTHNWDGQPLPETLMLWVSPRHTPIDKNLKPDCPHSQFWQAMIEHHNMPAKYGCVCECVGSVA